MTSAMETWLAEATKGLVPEAAARVNAMYRDCAIPPAEDAATANVRFQKTYITERDLLYTGVAVNRLIASVVILNLWFGFILWVLHGSLEMREQWNVLATLIGSMALTYTTTMIWGFRRAFRWFGWLGAGLRNVTPHRTALFLSNFVFYGVVIWFGMNKLNLIIYTFALGIAVLSFSLWGIAVHFRAKLFATYTQPELDALAQRFGFIRASGASATARKPASPAIE